MKYVKELGIVQVAQGLRAHATIIKFGFQLVRWLTTACSASSRSAAALDPERKHDLPAHTLNTNTCNIWRKAALWWLEPAKNWFKLNWITRCWYIHQVVKQLPPSVLEYFITSLKKKITIPLTVIPIVFHVSCPISAPWSHLYKSAYHLYKFYRFYK